MKYLVQLMRAETGDRTQPFVTDIEEFAAKLRDADAALLNDYIIVIAGIDETNEEQLDWISSPVFTVQSFLISQFPEDYVSLEVEEQLETLNGETKQ